MKGWPNDYWAKCSSFKNADGVKVVRAWHRLSHHLIDVSCVFWALMQVPGFRRRLAVAGGLQDLTYGQVARLCVFVFIHDIGKLNPGFQFKVFLEGLPPCGKAGHVIEACSLIHHESLSSIFLDGFGFREMCERWFADPDSGVSMALASWAHHGSPVEYVMDGSGTKPPLEVWNRWKWADPNRELVRLRGVVRECFPEAFEDTADPLPGNPWFQHVFAGLVSLADWIASKSDNDFFPYSTPNETEETRMAFAKMRAKKVVRDIGIDSHLARSFAALTEPSFKDMFGFNPRPMQEAMQRAPLPTRSSLLSIESETGSGKTEAALYHGFRLMAAGLVDSIYLALPTRTSAVQIHGRVVEAAGKVFGEHAPPSVLAVPGYIRVDAIDGRKEEGSWSVKWDDPFMGVRGWAAENSKRYLSAAIAVGTIDQALMSIVRSKHSHMRSVSLMRSLLIVDEVHASDPYMTMLTRVLVKRHLALGGHVLLMSATLGSSAKSHYFEEDVPLLGSALKVPYPLISWKIDGQRGSIDVGGNGRSKTVKLKTLPYLGWRKDGPEKEDRGSRAVAEQAIKHAKSGARVLVVRNTVRACVETQKALEEILASERDEAAEKMLRDAEAELSAAEESLNGSRKHFLDAENQLQTIIDEEPSGIWSWITRSRKRWLEEESSARDKVERAAASIQDDQSRVKAAEMAVEACRSVAAGAGTGLLFKVNGVPAPHHGRFAAEDRMLLDREIEGALGKSEGRGIIVVATQTVEQSLDIDCDILLTDLCPMDVLLQRIGRLHRHAWRTRPEGYETPVCEVIVPADRDLTPYVKFPRDAFGMRGEQKRAYCDVRVIEATWRQIEEKGTFVIPEMNRELVEWSTHYRIKDRIADELSDNEPVWHMHMQEIIGMESADTATAHLALTEIEAEFGSGKEQLGESGSVSTRLGAHDSMAVFDEAFTSPIGAEIKSIKIPAWMAEDVAQDEKPVILSKNEKAVNFKFAGSAFAYTAHGLFKI